MGFEMRTMLQKLNGEGVFLFWSGLKGVDLAGEVVRLE